MTLRRVPSSIVKSTSRGRWAKSPKDYQWNRVKCKTCSNNDSQIGQSDNIKRTYFESHEFVIRAGRPSVDLDAVTQRDDEEFNFLIFDDLEMNRALEVAHINPAVALLDILVADALGAQNFGLEPREVVNADAVLLARYRHQNVLAFQHFHLLEPPTWY